MRFENEIAIVTGAGRGIGAATAKRLAAEGAKVVLVSRSESELNEVKADIESSGGEAIVCPTDMADLSQIDTLFDTCIETYGVPTILVNNAAIIAVIPWLELDMADFEKMMRVNVNGVAYAATVAFRHMKAAGIAGSIVNVSSVSGIQNIEQFPGFGPYSMSKFAVVGLTESMAVECRDYGIRVNAIAPGAVETKMLRDCAPGLKTSVTPEHMASTICYLCDSSESSHMNGVILTMMTNAS